MNKIITLFHGSEKVIEAPSFGEGKRNNDFGLGFYCTETENLATDAPAILRGEKGTLIAPAAVCV